MSDELILSGGGSVAVATDAMLTAMAACERAASEVREASGGLEIAAARLDDWADAGAAGHALRLAAMRSRDAAALARSAEPPAAALGTALQLASHGYGLAERAATGAAEFAAEQLAATVARMLPGFVLAALPQVAVVAAAVAAVALVAPHAAAALGLDDEIAAVGSDVREALGRLVADPRVVALIRQGVMVADDAVLGSLGVPAPVTAIVGEDGAGLAGLPFVGTLITGIAGGIGLLRETPIRMAETRVVTSGPVVPAQGWSERFERIPAPTADGDGMQVRIEQYTMTDGGERFEVYVSGTVTFDPVAADEPWDMTSNVENAIGADAASVRAVAEAMRAAGIDATTPVILNGYSQGGGVVARIATLEEFDVVGLVAFGGNTGQTPIPPGIAAVLVEHDDDLVPALGGRQDNDQALLVRREAYGADAPPPPDVLVPAHRRPAYAETAALMDAATSDRMTSTTAQFAAFTDGATSVTVSSYRFERVP